MTAFLTTLLMLPLTMAAETPATILDGILGPVVAACVITDLAKEAPTDTLKAAGWVDSPEGWIKGDRFELLIVNWPGTPEVPTGCSLYSTAHTANEFNDWFEGRIGRANSIPWDPGVPLSAWRINTNNHRAGIYVAHDVNPQTELTSSVIHILQ